jgi:hypothetical protein
LAAAAVAVVVLPQQQQQHAAAVAVAVRRLLHASQYPLSLFQIVSIFKSGQVGRALAQVAVQPEAAFCHMSPLPQTLPPQT